MIIDVYWWLLMIIDGYWWLLMFNRILLWLLFFITRSVVCKCYNCVCIWRMDGLTFFLWRKPCTKSLALLVLISIDSQLFFVVDAYRTFQTAKRHNLSQGCSNPYSQMIATREANWSWHFLITWFCPLCLDILGATLFRLRKGDDSMLAFI